MVVVQLDRSHLTSERLGRSDLREGEAEAVVIIVRNEPWGRKARPITDVTSTALGKEKWRYV
jgi:hypothetical protein